MYLSASYTIKLAPTRTGVLAIPASDSTSMFDQRNGCVMFKHQPLYNPQKLMGILSNLMATVMSNRHLVGTANCQNLLNVSGCFFGGRKNFDKGHTLFLLFFITIDFIVYLHLMTIKFTNDFFSFLT